MATLKYDNPLRWTKLAKPQEIIANWIKEGSIVLECGCATGYMTRYLMQQRKCEVYIVEYDREAYENALQYAKSGVCGDLMEDQWLEAFQDVKFDYVIFSDVLEHLYDPADVLKKSASLLKDDGHVLCSIPNVTNSGIIGKMCQGHWDYTDVGLLDNTHIRFFGPYNLQAFFDSSNLKIIEMEYNLSGIFGPDQRPDISTLDGDILSGLLRNPWGSIYQFVINAVKKGQNDSDGFICLPPTDYPSMVKGCIYYGDESGRYSRDRCELFGIRSSQIVRVDKELNGSKYLRIDPVEGFSCVVKSMKAFANGEEIRYSSINGTDCSVGIVFTTNDPQIIFVLPDEAKEFTIEYEVEPVFSEFKKCLLTEIENCQKIIAIKEREITSKQSEVDHLNEILQDIRSSLSWRLTAPLRKIKSFVGKESSI